MKTLSLLLIIGTIFFSCTKSEPVVVQKSLETVAVVEELKEISLSGIVKYVSKDTKYEIYYDIFTNSYHNNGFVIVKRITVFSKGTLVHQYKLQNLVKDYIYAVDDPKKVEYLDTVNSLSVNLSDKTTCDIVRTAEAVLIAYFEGVFTKEGYTSNGPSEEHVYAISKRMIGRKTGLMAGKPIWKK